ncbi:MAG: LPS export ABC transporter periplasmic protein LptC [Xanthomonadales bacterium]|nr:LPS export ABC transporter periplasmic protein LptC [Xanthomonadales bacterium]
MTRDASLRRLAWLLPIALATGWWAWQLQEKEAPPPFVGPPRSDYAVDQFELIAFDDAGAESFSLRGPRLARHPELGSFDVEAPRIRVPDTDGKAWDGRADRAWISRDGELVKLRSRVDFRGPATAGFEPLRLRGDELDLMPKVRTATSEVAVTLTGPGSILRGRGLRADLNARRMELLNEVRGRYEVAAP